MNTNNKALSHIGIPTNKMKETILFYEKLGFKKIFETIVDNKEFVFIQYKDLVIEFFEVDNTNHLDGAINHFAINVNNINSVYNWLEEEKFKIITNGIEKLPFFDNGVQFCIIEGINGEKIEFSQII
ncbi:VOC family protein [Megamonas funiformis]|uniref:VOC family protein n=1 Tax=Megamonas funiformis TaxID=437897 RepID=UPI0022E93A46|nr:VOC family protein [Megamonas funiformis]